MRKINILTSSIRTALVVGVVGSFNVAAFAEDKITAVEVAQVVENQTEETVDTEEIEVVEVTGSHIKTNALEGVSPVTVIDAEEMLKKGFATAYDALKDLTQNTGVTQGAEAASSGSFTPNGQSLNLRGLGGNQTLVLVNGRRVADYPAPYNGASNFVNLSSIPAAAISRMEILTSGASAIYGSDAIAGVVNIITKKNVDDTTFTAKVGTTTEGGGDEARFQLVTGVNSSDYTVTLALEYQKQDPIYSSERDYLDSVDDGPLGEDAALHRGIVIVDQMAQRGFYPDDEETEEEDESVPWYRDPTEGRCHASGSGYAYTDRYTITDDEDDDDFFWGNYCGVDLSGTRTLRNERETVSAYLSSEYNITDDIIAYADVMYSQQDAFVQGGFHFVNTDILHYTEGATDGNMKILEDPDTGIEGDFEGAAQYDWRTEQRLFAQHELGFQSQSIEDSAIQINAGFKGVVFDNYDWELSFSRSENVNDKYAQQLRTDAVNRLYKGGYNTHTYWFEEQGIEHYDGVNTVGLYSPVTGDMRNDLVGTQVVKADSYSNTYSGVISGPVMELPAGDMYFALIAEYNTQGYDIDLDDETLEGGWYNLTGTEGGGERDRYAVGLELQFPIIDTLSAQLAGRYDQYDDDTTDVGGRFTPQVGMEYRPLDELLIRGNWGKSFRAPDMHRVFATDGGYYTTAIDFATCEDAYYDQYKDDDGDWETPIEEIAPFDEAEGEDIPCVPQSVKGNSTGSKTLKEEEGTTYGLGFVWDPTDSLSLTFDYYSIEIKNEVTAESIGGILFTDYQCKIRQDDDEDGENYYPYLPEPSEGITPGSQQCDNNAENITRKDGGLAGPLVESVSTSHINTAERGVKGIDAKANYHYESSFGDWYATVAWTHTLEQTFKATEDGEEVSYRDKAWNKSARSIMNGSLTWVEEDLSVTLSGRRIGSIPITNAPKETSDEDSYFYQKVQRLDPYYTFNLTSAYFLTDDFKMSAQVTNVLNERPPTDKTAYSWPFYNGAYGGAAVGRTVSATMTYVF